MRTAVGIFQARADAGRALGRLREAGVPEKNWNVLTPASDPEEIEGVPTVEAEPPGISKAMGGVLGGALSASGGLAVGAAASAFLPGVGPIFAAGVAAAGLLGVAGAAAGASAGDAVGNALAEGLPRDELFLYEDALREGRTAVIVVTDRKELRDRACDAMEAVGAESLDAARERWWLGLRGVEEESYWKEGGNFSLDEPAYRMGFEAAMERLGEPYERAEEELRKAYPEVHASPAFRRGYERGRARPAPGRWLRSEG
ncbi:MAG: hypothetical protein PVF68_17055 [Acidobacteriota bacterium]|jgi:hypothetical protein